MIYYFIIKMCIFLDRDPVAKMSGTYPILQIAPIQYDLCDWKSVSEYKINFFLEAKQMIELIFKNKSSFVKYVL